MGYINIGGGGQEAVRRLQWGGVSRVNYTRHVRTSGRASRLAAGVSDEGRVLHWVTMKGINHDPHPNHRQDTEAPYLCKCRVPGRIWHWGFYRYLVRARVGQLPHTYRRSVSNISSMSLSDQTAGRRSWKKEGDSSKMYILKMLLF